MRTPSIAVIGPDGAGKTTITRMLERSRILRLKYLYMGINTSSSNIALPTSRLVEYLKPRLGRGAVSPHRHANGGSTLPASAKKRGVVWVTARLINRLAEQWFRQFVAWSYQVRGHVVLYDRHFVFDFGGKPVAGETVPLDKRIYQWCLVHLSPRPDLVILLDAPGEVLYARKGESTIAELEDRRQRLLQQGKSLPAFIPVDATRPLQTVYEEVVNHVVAFCADPRGHMDTVRAAAATTVRRSPIPGERVFASPMARAAADD